MIKKTTHPYLIWITGLPGAGKTTLAKEVYRLLKGKRPTVLMDGDVFREIMGNDLGYSSTDRLKNAQRLARMNHYLIQHGITVVCSTVSLFKEIHAWNKKKFPHFLEVYIEVSAETLHERDQKKLYSQKNLRNDVVGIHQIFDKPQNPDIIIENAKGLRSFLSNAERIIKAL